VFAIFKKNIIFACGTIKSIRLNMTTLQLNEELQRQLGYISDDADLMKKAIAYIKKLGRSRGRTYGQETLEKDLDELLAVFRTEKITQEEIDRECESVRQGRYDGSL